VPGEHRGGRRFKLGRPLGQLHPRSAPALRRVARQLHAVDGEHFPADEALRIANCQHCRKERDDLVAQGTHEVGDRGEVRCRRPAEGDEGHVVLARAGDPAAAHDAVGVRTEDDLQQHLGRVRRGARDIIAEPRIERGHVQFVLEPVMDRVLNGAGQELLRQIDG
jgi:hypothetical protein